LNDKILDTSSAKYVSFGNEVWEPSREPKNPVAAFASSLNYLVPPSKKKTPISVTLWILTDVTTPEGHAFLLNALEFLQESSTHSRIAFIPTDDKVSTFKTSLLEAFTDNDMKKALSLLRDQKHDSSSSGTVKREEKVELFLKLTGFPKDGKGLVVNGRIIGPLSQDETFDVGDWALVEKFSYDSCAKHFGKFLESTHTLVLVLLFCAKGSLPSNILNFGFNDFFICSCFFQTKIQKLELETHQ